MGYFLGLLKFQIVFGVLEIPNIFLGVNGRCWVRAYVWLSLCQVQSNISSLNLEKNILQAEIRPNPLILKNS